MRFLNLNHISNSMLKKLLPVLVFLVITALGFGQKKVTGQQPAEATQPAADVHGTQTGPAKQTQKNISGNPTKTKVVPARNNKIYPVQYPHPVSVVLPLTADNYRLYQGDTLDGFDFNAAFSEVKKVNGGNYPSQLENLHLMQYQESKFVSNKYHLPPPAASTGHGSPAQHARDLQKLLLSQMKSGGTNPHVLAGCNNADFETGDFTGWTGAYGFNAGTQPNGLSMFCKSFTIGSPDGPDVPVSDCQPHTLISGGTDPYANVAMLDPGGGSWDCRLGGDSYNLNYNEPLSCWGGSTANGNQHTGGFDDPQVAYTPTPPYSMFWPYSYAQTLTTATQGHGFYSGAELLEQQFAVDATNCLYTYNYSVILQDGGHPTGDMPYFEVDVYDGSGNPINCLQYYQECTSGAPPVGGGYFVSPSTPGVYCSGWQSNTLDLSGYAPQTITIYFSAAGCSHGGHFGYAYIDGSCGPKQLSVSTPAACVGSTMTVTAPPSPTGTTFSWTGPSILGYSPDNSVITVGADGIYTVTVTPGNGCSYTVSTSVTFAQPAGITPSQTNVSCNGSGNGTATATATGGNPAYTYNWTGAGYGGGGQGSAVATGLAPGTYTCTVTTANGCSSAQTYNIVEPGVLSSSVSAQTNVNCNGGNTGSATVAPTGGTSAYGYNWSPAPGGGQGTATATGLTGQTYNCTITDAHGCTHVQAVTITQPASPLASSVTSQTNVNCNGGNTGSATINATGGTSAYGYNWAPAPGGGQGTTSITGLTNGTYNCTITDAKGCTHIQAVTITQPVAPLSSSVSSQTNVNCNGGSTGSATISVVGGTSAYGYVWAPAPGGGQGTATITGLSNGTYNCSITDAKGCTHTQAVTITQPAAPLSSSISTQTNVNCNGGNTGSATINVAGGTSAYGYNWAPAPGGGQGTATATGLSNGTYNCTITDAKGCTNIQAVTITQPIAPLSSSVTTQTNVNCNGGSTGSATINVAGGTSAYGYAWAPAPGGGQGTASITGLSNGTYNCTITDAKGCTHIQAVTITQPVAPLSSSISTQTNVNCNGGSTGSATINVAGGTSAYGYVWAPAPGGGQGTATITGLSNGTYNCSITDAKGCTTTQSVTITQPVAPLSSSVSAQTNVNCNGGSTGSATISVAGGTSAYGYAWAPAPGGGQGTATATGLANGTYNCTITDAKGCTTIQAVTITQPVTGLSSAITVQDNVACSGGNNGDATISVSGGTSAYAYNWVPAPGGGQGTAAVTGLSNGTYNCTITDAKGCTTIQSVNITQPLPLTTSASQLNASCNGASSGSATITPSGGTPAYAYTWSQGGTSATAGGLAAGTYTCTVKDGNKCIAKQVITITQPTVIAIAPATTQTGCGVSTGTATGTVSGGTPGYTYTWAPAPGGGQGTNAATGLGGGTYTLTVHDNNACPQTQSFSITSAGAPSSSISSQAAASCSSSCNGSATVNATGGTPGYTYTWSPSGGNAATATSLCAGSYNCTIKDAANCTTVQSVTIVAPAVLASTVTAQTNVNCNGGSTGTATITPTGGTSAYAYNWAPAPGGGQGTATATGLANGTYNCTITDAHGCTHIQPVTVTQPAAALSSSVSAQSNVKCNGGTSGTATVGVAGGTSSYTYNWVPAPGTGQGTATVTGLSNGTYHCNITDANGCTTTQAVVITQPVSPLATTISAQSNVKCNGGSTGSASVNVTGGTSAYAYNWTPPPGTGQGTASVTGLTNGSYTCNITDANNCTTSQVVSITQPVNPLSATISSHANVTCNGSANGTATATVSGGTSLYTYSWSPSGGTAATASGLAPGTYTCNIVDANGCTTSQSLAITQPSPLAITPSSTLTGCGISTGTASVSVAGGTSAYAYNWSPAPGGGQGTANATGLAAGSYTITVTDANACTQNSVIAITSAGGPSSSLGTTTNALCKGSCNGSVNVTASGGTGALTYSWSPSGGNLATASSLCAGTYTCTITDANNCSTSQAVVITEPNVLAITPTQANASCSGTSTGSATATVSGGTSTYNYTWAPSGGSSATASNLSAGTYTCSVTDNNGCPASQTYTITQPTPLSLVPASTQTGCGGAATGTASVTSTSGGTGAPTYNWSPAPGTGQGTNSVTGLGVGTYTVTITDANGCHIDSLIKITAAGAPSSSITSQAATKCNASCDGTATVAATGGSGGYTYVWSPSGGNTASAANLCAGNYVCTITDNMNCSTTQSVTIIQPVPLAVAPAQTNALCNGGSTGTATATVTGGTSVYTYAWTPSGGSNPTASGLAAGTYVCNVTDANGCSTSETYTITQPATALAITPSQTNATCNGSTTGSITATVSGGTSAYTYSWSVPGAGPTVTGLGAGTYTCVVTDKNGCATSQQLFTITQPAALSATVTPSSATCLGSNGSAAVTPNGGTATYTYSWSSGSTTASATGLAPGNYSCVVTDANHCTTTVNTTINNTGVKPVAGVSVVSGSANFCAGTNSILSASGGGTYLWSTGATTDSITVTTAGSYSVVVTNTCGSDSTHILMTVQPLPNPVITGNSGMCKGDSIQLTASGGNSYLWSTGASGSSIWVHNTGSYSVSATNGCGTVASTNFPVTVNTVNAYFSANTLNGSSPLPVNFTDSSTSATTWTWNYGDGNTGSGQTGANETFNTAGNYTVTLTVTNGGCTSTYSQVITVTENPSYLQTPNVFSPNGDGLNDVWFVNYAGIDYFNCKIYDRWGVAMAELVAPGVAWDGTTMAGEPASDGTYYYAIHATGNDGKKYDLTGFITLVRTH